MSQVLAEEGSRPSKGWVRDGVLSYLSKRPGTATEIAKELGVSKATVSYHTKALVRKGMIEISDVKSIRGGVYSKTYELKQGSLALTRRRDGQRASLAKADEWFERLLMSLELEPTRRPAEELELFLYHLFSLLAESDSLESGIFEEYGRRIGEGLGSDWLKFKTLRAGLNELTEYMNSYGIAQLNAEVRKGEEPRLVCTGCLENKDFGGLVCSFTKGILTGAIRARDGRTLRLDRAPPERTPGCVYVLKRRGFRT